MIRRRLRNRPLWEVWLVWLLFGLTTVAVFEAYWRLPPSELWKTSNSGFVGGIGRAFVFLSFSAALVSPGVIAIAVDRLRDRRADLLGGVAVLFCATNVIPGVQTTHDLDPKWANLPAVLGVALAIFLTAWASRRGRVERVLTSRVGDRARLVVAALVLFFAAPYIAAELGFHLDGVPFLGWFFQTGAIKPEPGAGYAHAAVHYGHHHGLDGFLLAVSALLLWRLLGGIRRPALHEVTAFYLSLMLVYGLTNQAEDLWIEQVAKRGWTSWLIPDVLYPSLSAAWVSMLAVAVLFYRTLFRPARGRDEPAPAGQGLPRPR